MLGEEDADSVISFSVVTFSGPVITFACGEEAQDEEDLSSEDFFRGRESTTLRALRPWSRSPTR